jgi:pyruvate ferredoxin oxidoreductase gamma subunit
MIEIIFSGKGGQGAVKGAEFLAKAAFLAGKESQVLYYYTPAQKGGETKTFVRISKKPIIKSCYINNADVLVIFNSDDLMENIFKIKSSGWLILNARELPGKIDFPRIALVDADKIAYDLKLGQIINTPMLGAFVKATKIVSLKILEDVLEKTDLKREENIKALQMGFDETKIINR